MNIEIKSLTQAAHNEMIAACGNRIFDDVSGYYEGVYDVTINESASMKVYDDVIFFDLGGNITSVHRQDFHEITIA